MHIESRMVCTGLLAITLSLVPGSAHAQHPTQPYSGRDTWYEFLLKKCNPSNFNYGAWLEQQRRAFLEATVKEPHFWYSFAATAGLLILMAAYAKLSLDHRRSVRVAEEMMADLYSHDLYSLQAAKEAIERHNQHIEQCNRAIEASDRGDARPGWGETQLDTLKAELQRVATQLEATTQDRNKLQEELRQKVLVVADLSMRLDALSKKVDGVRTPVSEPRQPASPNQNGDGARFVGHINRLQEELYAERQKNRRLKGA
jgi:hypothetical protein